MLRYENIPDDLSYNSEDILLNAEKTTVRSLSGIRDVMELKAILPSQQNFTETLKAVKLWAMRKNLLVQQQVQHI